jgi:hypothetical protein
VLKGEFTWLEHGIMDPPSAAATHPAPMERAEPAAVGD